MSLSGFFAVENSLAVENFSTPALTDRSQTGGATAQIDQEATDAPKALRAKQ